MVSPPAHRTTPDHLMAEGLDTAARRVDIYLQSIFSEGYMPERLGAAMRHALLVGGKRFRPFLVMETARIFQPNPPAAPGRDPAVVVGGALECVHAYSLVHDDLPAMDNDQTRRGQPTVWVKFDDATAILAGDGLLTHAFRLIGGLAEPHRGQPRLLKPETALRLVVELADASGYAGMVGGQQLDLDAERRPSTDRPTEADVRRIQTMKTGALIRFACRGGAIAAGASESEIAGLTAYAEHLGLAFQISDDLLDATGSAELVGKAVGKDAGRGKGTFIDIYGIDGARKKLAETEAAAIAALAPFGPRAVLLEAAARFMTQRKS
ncbi:MAG: hypothetical protein RL291_172 [Pseudomonadota bacterium]